MDKIMSGFPILNCLYSTEYCRHGIKIPPQTLTIVNDGGATIGRGFKVLSRSYLGLWSLRYYKGEPHNCVHASIIWDSGMRWKGMGE